MERKRASSGFVGGVLLLAMLAMLAILAGCDKDPAPPKGTVVPAGGTPVAIQAQPLSPGRADIQTLQQGRRQDAQVISDANKALGVLHP